jgi:hypothetical protein
MMAIFQQRDVFRVKLGEFAIVIRILLRASARKDLQEKGEWTSFPFPGSK